MYMYIAGGICGHTYGYRCSCMAIYEDICSYMWPFGFPLEHPALFSRQPEMQASPEWMFGTPLTSMGPILRVLSKILNPILEPHKVHTWSMLAL